MPRRAGQRRALAREGAREGGAGRAPRGRRSDRTPSPCRPGQTPRGGQTRWSNAAARPRWVGGQRRTEARLELAALGVQEDVVVANHVSVPERLRKEIACVHWLQSRRRWRRLLRPVCTRERGRCVRFVPESGVGGGGDGDADRSEGTETTLQGGAGSGPSPPPRARSRRGSRRAARHARGAAAAGCADGRAQQVRSRSGALCGRGRVVRALGAGALAEGGGASEDPHLQHFGLLERVIAVPSRLAADLEMPRRKGGAQCTRPRERVGLRGLATIRRRRRRRRRGPEQAAGCRQRVLREVTVFRTRNDASCDALLRTA